MSESQPGTEFAEAPPDVTDGTARAEIRAFTLHAGIYTIANILNRVFPFLLLPLLTRYLTPAEYGMYVLFQVLLNFLLPFIGFNAEAAASRAYFTLEGAELDRYLSTALALIAATTVVLFAVALLAGGPLGHALEFPGQWLPVVVLVAATESIKAIQLAVWQVQQRARAYATLTAVQTAVRFITVLCALLFARQKLVAVIWCYALTLFAFGLLSLFYLWRDAHVRVRLDRSHAAALLRYGLPLVPHRVAGWLMGMADRVVITRFVGLAEMGVYSLGYSLGATVGMVQDALNRAWVPFFFEWLKRGDEQSRSRIGQFILAYSIGVLALAALVTVIAPVLFPLFGPRFAAARVFVIFIAFSSALNGIYKMAGNFLFFTERTYLLSSITIAVGLLSIGINVALVSHFGVIGAGYSAVIAQALLCISVFSVTRRLFSIPWRIACASLFAELRALVGI